MVTIAIGADAAADLPPGLRENGVVGTVDQVVERLLELQDAGLDRVMLQHLRHDDLETIELIGRELIPRVS
jgi:alkanesulfonate monooxygenase SsuD/methylene tetrahydromethanopterin reductase-like flavin-dependent oxidoreductase (luciferase family)